MILEEVQIVRGHAAGDAVRQVVDALQMEGRARQNMLLGYGQFRVAHRFLAQALELFDY